MNFTVKYRRRNGDKLSDKSEKTKAFILMCILVCMWGLDYIVAKKALEVLGTMNLLFLKYLIGLLLVLAIKLKKKVKTLIRLKDIPFFILCSLTGEILYYYCDYTAMSYLPVSIITVILAFVPVLSILIERVIFKKRFTAKILIGILVCVVGVGIVIGADFRLLLNGRLIGYILAFGSVISWNMYNFITAHLSEHYESIAVTFNQLLCTLLIVSPYAIHTMPPMETFTPSIMVGVLYLGLGSVGAGFLIMVRGLKALGPTISAMFSNFLPVTATFFGWLFLKESLSPMQVAGGIIVILSSCIVIREKGKLDELSDKEKNDEPDGGV